MGRPHLHAESANNCIKLCNFEIFCICKCTAFFTKSKLTEDLKGGLFIITLVLNSNKHLSAVNNAKVYYGENRIGNIRIKINDTIGEINTANCDFTLYVLFGGDYIRYPLDFTEENEFSLPITNDITEFIGDHEMYIEITSGGRVIGKTNPVALRVHPFTGLCEEITPREVYIARIEELEDIIAYNDNVFEDIKNAIASATVEISESTPKSEYGNLIRTIPQVVLSDVIDVFEGDLSGTYEIPRGTTKLRDYLFYRSDTNGFIIPNTVTELGVSCFSYCTNIAEITIPDSVISMNSNVFEGCTNLSSVNIGTGLTEIPFHAFYDCFNLFDITIPGNIVSIGNQAFCGTRLSNVNLCHGVKRLGFFSFAAIGSLTSLSIPNTLTNTGETPFNACSNLTNVTIENGFNANNLNLSASTRYTVNTIVSWLNALADRTGQITYNLIIGSSNINKLTAEQIAIATEKNWNLS